MLFSYILLYTKVDFLHSQALTFTPFFSTLNKHIKYKRAWNEIGFILFK